MFIYIPFAAYHSLSPIRGNLPILSELSLGTDDDFISDDEEILDVFEITPELRSVECVNLNPDRFKLPWDHIAKIPLMSVSVEDCIDILRRAVCLENGSFIYDVRGSRPPKPPSALYHPSLRELAVLIPRSSPEHERIDTRDVFKFLIAPNLRSLRIRNVRSPFGSELIAFLSKVNCLESLYLSQSNLSEEELLQVLEMTPSLEHLTILSPDTFCPVTEYLFDELVSRKSRNNDPLAPKLETIEVTIDSSIGWPFVQFLKSRCEVDEESCRISLLQKVNVTIYGDPEEDILFELETLTSAGMVIDVEYIVDDSHGDEE